MGKLFRGRNRYPDEEFANEEYEDDEIFEDEEFEDEGFEDDEIDDGLPDGSDEDFEGEADAETGDDDNEVDSDGDDDVSDDDDDGNESDDDDEEDDPDEEDEWEEDDRRVYRRRRRIRNQIISYAVVFVIFASLATGGMILGRNIAHELKEKKAAAEQEQLQDEQDGDAAHDIVIDAPEEIEVDEPEEDLLGGVVDSYISTMPLEDKVAGLFIVTPEALTGVTTATQAGTGTQEALGKYSVGGLIYFKKNILDREQITDMLSSTVSMSNYPLFLAVDEEGGSVSRVAESGIDVIQVGDMASIGASGDTSQAYEAGLTIGTYLKELGFNLDFAPVADVADSDDGVLGDRVFGTDAQKTGEMVANVVDGIEGTGVSSCLKHFPGIGDTTGDTHDGRVETTKTLDEMRSSDFISFKAGIDAGADFVMVSHVTVSSVDEDAVPSTLSKTIMTDVLRNELGFQGVIITDALNMGAITEYYTTEQAVVQAIEAGADMLLMPDDFQAAYDALLAAVQEGRISEERINESLERIYRIKCANKLENEM